MSLIQDFATRVIDNVEHVSIGWITVKHWADETRPGLGDFRSCRCVHFCSL